MLLGASVHSHLDCLQATLLRIPKVVLGIVRHQDNQHSQCDISFYRNLKEIKPGSISQVQTICCTIFIKLQTKQVVVINVTVQ